MPNEFAKQSMGHSVSADTILMARFTGLFLFALKWLVYEVTKAGVIQKTAAKIGFYTWGACLFLGLFHRHMYEQNFFYFNLALQTAMTTLFWCMAYYNDILAKSK